MAITITSRIGKAPINVPKGIEIKLEQQQLTVKGPKGELKHTLHPATGVVQEADQLQIIANDLGAVSRSKMPRKDAVNALCGTTRAVINNMVIGVSAGFTKKLTMVGVGYRGQVQGNKLVLSLGFSHPINYMIPAGIEIKMASPTEIEVGGIDKCKVGQVAAEIRAYRPPEPYKGKGVRYADEHVALKETKKK
ncbi:MAG: 50S ribosomal protein L6 [Gammaproteobacteria bacterium]|nr:50S ribosomal protein L6 [Gammaproteobacteria bacterium]